VSLEIERHVGDKQNVIDGLMYEIATLKNALFQHEKLLIRLNEAESVIQSQDSNNANEYKKKYDFNYIPFESCGKCLQGCACEEENE
jgi:hypothetical protein